MTATDELRRLLDERGVKWWPMHDIENGYHEDRDTEFLVWGCKHVAHEWGCRLQVDMLTPAQAVEATLGRGECEIEERRDGWGVITRHCGNCGADLDCDTRNKQNYCPSCGLRLVKR